MNGDRLASRLLVDPPASGPWNMAVDEVLLATAAEQGICSLRFYEWSEPTLSLGYFQPYAAREKHPGSLACPVVRRASGGGAIVHDRELTYCLAMPLAHPLAADALRLYTLVHEALTAALARWQISTALSPGSQLARQEEPFLCFARRAEGDVVVDHVSGVKSVLSRPKIAGSAQRRRQGAVVQHGSILLSRSEAAPELAGIEELTGVRLAAAELGAAWQPQLEAGLHLDWRPGALSAAEIAQVRSLAIEKYDWNGWTRRR
jgi:lipoate-protein ligase A